MPGLLTQASMVNVVGRLTLALDRTRLALPSNTTALP